MKKNFLFASWLFGLGNSFSAPLLGLYIYVNSSIFYTLKFLLITSLFILIGYLTVGYLVTLWNRAITYVRIGIGLYIAFYLLLLSLGKEATSYITFISMLYGLAQGFYWCGWDVVFYHTPNKLKFFNNSTYLSLITSLVSPAVYGSVLTLFHNSGYGILFILTSVFLILTFLLMEDVRIEVRSSIKSLLVIKEDNVYRVTMIALTIVGGVNYVLGSLNTILVYNVSRSYLTFTLINYVLTILSVLSVFVLRDKLINRIRPYKLVLLSSFALSLSGISLFLHFPLIYLVTFYITSPLIYPIIDVYNWNNMDRRFLMDYLINRQIMLNTGRMLSSLLEVMIASSYVSDEITMLLPFVVIASLIFARKVKQPIQ